MSVVSFPATITDKGQILANEIPRLALWRFRGQRVTVSIKRETRTKSQEQLGYLWGVVYPLLAEHIGQSVQETHQDCKDRLLGQPHDGPLGPTHRTPSLRDLDMRKTALYVDEVIRLAASIGCYVPEAGRPLIDDLEAK